MNVSAKSNFFVLNLIFLIIIGVVFCYSYFFYPNNQPITCFYKLRTGLDCNSCGFSRAFSAFTHFEFSLGKAYNPFAFKCYIFFIVQFFIRLFYVLYVLINHKIVNQKIIISEMIITIAYFLYCFLPLIQN